MMGGPTTQDSPGSKGHAWNIITLNGLNYALDVTWDDMSGGASGVEHTYFNLPVTAFGDSRSWNELSLPPGTYAQSFDAQYFYSTPVYTASDASSALDIAEAQLNRSGTAYVFSPAALDLDSVTETLRTTRASTLSIASLAAEMPFTLIKYTDR